MNASKQQLARAIIQTLARPSTMAAAGRKRRRKRRGKGIIGTVANLFGLGKKRRKRKVRL